MAKSSTSFTSSNNPAKGRGGPGRPPLDKSITAKLRAKINPQDIADLYAAALADESLDLRLRLEVAERVTNRLEGTPIQSLRTQADDLPQIIIAGPSEASHD